MGKRSMSRKASKAGSGARRNGDRRCLRRIPAGAQHHHDVHPARGVRGKRGRDHQHRRAGPGLSPQGKGQAEQARAPVGAQRLRRHLRLRPWRESQQTAAPLAGELGKQVEVLHGIQEINAGWYQGKPVDMASSTYLLAPADWLNGDLKTASPGRSPERIQRPVHRGRPEGLRQRPPNPVVFSQIAIGTGR